MAKPLRQLEYRISRLSIINNVGVDPFMGTGIIGRAALNLDRRFKGIERDNEIFSFSSSRIVKGI